MVQLAGPGLPSRWVVVSLLTEDHGLKLSYLDGLGLDLGMGFSQQLAEFSVLGTQGFVVCFEGGNLLSVTDMKLPKVTEFNHPSGNDCI